MQTLLKKPILFLLGVLGFVVLAQGAEETAIVTEGKVNVRGQPSLIGEVVTQLQKGESVTVLEYVENERAKGGEPTNWAKIKLPSNTPVWVYTPLVKDGTVSATRLNLRAGPGDNYSVIGRLTKGDKVKAIRTMGDWTEVEAPPSAYAFVDSSLIKPAGGSSAAPAAPSPIPATPPLAAAHLQTNAPPLKQGPTNAEPLTQVARNTVTAPQAPQEVEPARDALAAVTTPTPAPRTVIETPAPAINSSTATPSAAAPAAAPLIGQQQSPNVTAKQGGQAEPTLEKRIVRREGIVRATRSIQAPTWYELVHPQTKKTIDYLHEEKMGIKLKEFKGQKVVVSGEEAVDPRWPNTPILELETLDVAP